MIKQQKPQDYFEAMEEKDLLNEKTPFLPDDMIGHGADDMKQTHQAIAA